MSLKGFVVCAGTLAGLLFSSMNASALTLSEEFQLNRRIYGGIEQRVETSARNSFVSVETEEGDISQRYQNPVIKKECSNPFKRASFLWDESSIRWIENVKHNSGSEELDEIYGGSGVIMARFPGILDETPGSSGGCDLYDRFLWVPGFGAQLLLKDFGSQLDNGNPGEGEEDQSKAIKTFVTWTLSSDWRYYFESNWYVGLLFRHKSHDRFSDDVDLDEFFGQNPGTGIDETDRNILSYQAAFTSDSKPFNWEIRGLWNIWQTAPHPAWIVSSHFDNTKRLPYKKHLATDGRVRYSFTDKFGIYSEAQAEFPNLLKHKDVKIPFNLSAGIQWGKFTLSYEISGGRPDGLIIPNGYTTDSNNKKPLVLGFRY